MKLVSNCSMENTSEPICASENSRAHRTITSISDEIYVCRTHRRKPLNNSSSVNPMHRIWYIINCRNGIVSWYTHVYVTKGNEHSSRMPKSRLPPCICFLIPALVILSARKGYPHKRHTPIRTLTSTIPFKKGYGTFINMRRAEVRLSRKHAGTKRTRFLWRYNRKAAYTANVFSATYTPTPIPYLLSIHPYAG